MEQLITLIDECGDDSRARGFNLRQHATQIALIATEVVESLEELYFSVDSNPHLVRFIYDITQAATKFEKYRSTLTGLERNKYIDDSQVVDQESLLKELSDICIRVFSYVSGNGLTPLFVDALREVIDANKLRPYLHNKGF